MSALPAPFSWPSLALSGVLLVLLLISLLRWRYWYHAADSLRHALHQPYHGIALIDPEGGVLFWNRWMAELTGISERQALHRLLTDLPAFPPDHPIVRMLFGVMPHPTDRPLIFRTQIQRVGATGTTPVIINLSRFAASSPGGFLIMLSVTDVTEAEDLRHRLQSAVENAESSVRRMAELDRLKSEFLAICGHELKTPLVSITGYLDLMASERLGPLTDKQTNAVTISLKNASRLNELLSQLLDFARMEAGTMRFDFIPQRIGTVLEEMIQVVMPMASAKQITIVQEIQAELPRALFDAGLIHRVILNLLDNAVKFTPQGGTITVKATADERYVTVEIVDTGIGIDGRHIERVKEPFFQTDTSDTRRTGGMGLGLAIVEKILHGHGSRLELSSEDRHGTTARFSLRIAQKKSSAKLSAISNPQE
ncbi:MAG TPA: PAS domain-containing sensor histidine kinase [Candidatus Ozemobacteraceae bacterium]|nr:PAS domain-containing sensor histidine kinase [Candidatus Ozemobacteraceae bacterium]HQG28247.1 PAS domain-containing sensor histidine kinase [Candidatus Ozemobacteraceae bacterium]